MAGQHTGAGPSVVADGSPVVLPDDVDVKIQEPFTGNRGGLGTHPMGRVTHRARKTVSRYVPRVLRETRVGQNLRQIVTLAAQRVRSIRTEIRVRVGIGDRSSRRCRLAELVVALQDVRVYRTVWSVGAGSTEFPVIVAVVTIRAEDPWTSEPRRNGPVQVQHVQPQAGLR